MHPLGKNGKRKATDIRHHTRIAMMDSKAGCDEKSDNDGDLDSDDIASTSSGSQVLISHEQQDESGEKQEDSRFKRRKTAKFKKHPDAPKRFRSAFIIFSQYRHKQLRAKLNAEGGEIDTMNIAGQISDEWRNLQPDAKRKWDEMARQDKERYHREKAEYAGPWKVRTNLRKPKDPNSPKKPVPAYFAFSNERRQEVKNSNPSATNGEVSRLLSKMWKDAPEEVRKLYLDKEAEEREKYTESMAEWKAKRRREATEQACEEANRVDSGIRHELEQANEKEITMQQINSGVHNVSPVVSFRETASFVPQSQGSPHAVGDPREDVRLNPCVTSSTFDAYSRLFHEQRLSQELLGAILLQQQSQAVPIERDTGVLLQLLSRIHQMPSQQSIGNNDLLRQLGISAPHGPNVANVISESDQHFLAASRLTSNNAGLAGSWLGGLTRIPPAPSSNLRQDTGCLDPNTSLDNIMNMLKRRQHQSSTGIGIRNGWIDESSLRQLFGGVTGGSGQTGPIHSAGRSSTTPSNAVLSYTPESTILLHMFQQRMVGEAASGTATLVTDLPSSLPSSNMLQDLLQQLGAVASIPRQR